MGRNIASIYVDGQSVASAFSKQKENVKFHVIKVVL